MRKVVARCQNMKDFYSFLSGLETCTPPKIVPGCEKPKTYPFVVVAVRDEKDWWVFTFLYRGVFEQLRLKIKPEPGSGCWCGMPNNECICGGWDDTLSWLDFSPPYKPYSTVVLEQGELND